MQFSSPELYWDHLPPASSPGTHLWGRTHPRLWPELEPWLLSTPGHQLPCFTGGGEVTSEG